MKDDTFEASIRLVRERISRMVDDALRDTPRPPAPFHPGQVRAKRHLVLLKGGKQ